MVYCELVSIDGNIAKYIFGGSYKDLTGVFFVNKDDLSFNLTKMPQNSYVLVRHLKSMLSNYIDEIKKGYFPDKMSREI